MSEENKQLVRRWFEEVWNNGRADAIDEMFDENGIAHGLADDPSNPIKGPSGYRPFYKTFRQAFPNIMVVVEDVIAEGDKVAVRACWRGDAQRGIPRGPALAQAGGVHRDDGLARGGRPDTRALGVGGHPGAAARGRARWSISSGVGKSDRTKPCRTPSALP